MPDINVPLITVHATDEVAAAPRSILAIVEDALGGTLPGSLVVSLALRNRAAAGALKYSHDVTMGHYASLAVDERVQVVHGHCRTDISRIYIGVAADNDPVEIELLFE